MMGIGKKFNIGLAIGASIGILSSAQPSYADHAFFTGSYHDQHGSGTYGYGSAASGSGFGYRGGTSFRMNIRIKTYPQYPSRVVQPRIPGEVRSGAITQRPEKPIECVEETYVRSDGVTEHRWCMNPALPHAK